MQLANPVAGRLYDAAKTATQPNPLEALPEVPAIDGAEAPSFVEAVGAVAEDAVATLVAGEETTKAMMAGKADAQTVVEALAATEMALEMAVSIRDKVVEAYQEILRMPV